MQYILIFIVTIAVIILDITSTDKMSDYERNLIIELQNSVDIFDENTYQTFIEKSDLLLKNNQIKSTEAKISILQRQLNLYQNLDKSKNQAFDTKEIKSILAQLIELSPNENYMIHLMYCSAFKNDFSVEQRQKCYQKTLDLYEIFSVTALSISTKQSFESENWFNPNQLIYYLLKNLTGDEKALEKLNIVIQQAYKRQPAYHDIESMIPSLLDSYEVIGLLTQQEKEMLLSSQPL